MRYKIIEDEPVTYCSHERIQRLKLAGIKTDGQIDGLKEIMSNLGLRLPVQVNNGYRFSLQDENGKLFIFDYINEADACAEKILKTIEK